jgi:hypothetical protein
MLYQDDVNRVAKWPCPLDITTIASTLTPLLGPALL